MEWMPFCLCMAGAFMLFLNRLDAWEASYQAKIERMRNEPK